MKKLTVVVGALLEGAGLTAVILGSAWGWPVAVVGFVVLVASIFVPARG